MNKADAADKEMIELVSFQQQQKIYLYFLKFFILG